MSTFYCFNVSRWQIQPTDKNLIITKFNYFIDSIKSVNHTQMCFSPDSYMAQNRSLPFANIRLHSSIAKLKFILTNAQTRTVYLLKLSSIKLPFWINQQTVLNCSAIYMLIFSLTISAESHAKRLEAND